MGFGLKFWEISMGAPQIWSNHVTAFENFPKIFQNSYSHEILGEFAKIGSANTFYYKIMKEDSLRRAESAPPM